MYGWVYLNNKHAIYILLRDTTEYLDFGSLLLMKIISLNV